MSAAPGSHANAGQAPRREMKNIVGGVVIGALTILTQIVLRRELAPGEFGTANALFGIAFVLLAPLAAFSLFARRELAKAGAENLHQPLLNRAAIGWSIACVVVLIPTLPLLDFPRVSLHFFELLVVTTGALAICARPATPIRWCAVIGIGAAVLRLGVSSWAGANWPLAESGLGALVLGALLAGLPALRDQPDPPTLSGAWKILRPSLVPGAAMISVGLALALFTNADRIAAQVNLGTPDSNNIVNVPGSGAMFADYRAFDAYQAAALCPRWLLWGLIPLLGLLFRQRSALNRTTYASLRWFWIYLGALFIGLAFLVFGGSLADWVFNPPQPSGYRPSSHSWTYGPIGYFLPQLAMPFFLIGLLEGIAVFALASRRHIECFVLAACSIGYTVVVFMAGHHAQIMMSVMGGAALISLALVLFVGVVRYARTHP